MEAEEKKKNVIAFGDVVCFFEGYDRLTFQEINKDTSYHCRFGHFPHKDLIGLSFGTKLQGAKGFIYLLEPTPELWTRGVLHRTQILYLTDIAMIIAKLGIKPGSRVLESGTGSGSLSTSIARAIMPNGHLFTFEYNDVRANMSKKDFAFNRIDNVITVECRDVVALGFPENDRIRKESIDAVFLDLPSPWSVVSSAWEMLKMGATICTFSPCIEQVQKTVAALYNHGFVVLDTLETLQRQFEVVAKRRKISNDKDKDDNDNDNDDDDDDKDDKNDNDNEEEDSDNDADDVYAKPFGQMKGHTGYLVFARKTAIIKK